MLRAVRSTTLLALLLVASCGGSSNDSAGSSAPTTGGLETTLAQAAPASTTPTSTTAAPTTTDVGDAPRRREAINKYVDAVAADRSCSAIECLFGDNLYKRWLAIRDLAAAIAGDDIRDYRSAVLAAWIAWDDCLTANQGTLEPCGELQTAYEQAFVDFYDAVR